MAASEETSFEAIGLSLLEPAPKMEAFALEL
jgi:hypothetical protein